MIENYFEINLANENKLVAGEPLKILEIKIIKRHN
jgi:hypothetical protein